MANFKFRYSKILEIKVQEEDDKKQLLATKISDMERIRGKLEEVKAQRLAYEERILSEMRGGVSAQKISSYNRFKKWYRDEIENFETRLDMAQRALSIAREELLTATQEVKKIEKLKEKAFNEYKFKEEKAMQEMIEETINFQMAKERE
ncbi:MAG: flagellar export protein FliJ [Bacillota bacterium]|nr:flagellar export protein FliJ [Bacillota bacterium]